MKNTLTIAMFWLFCNSMNAQLVINEVFYNAPGGGADPLEFIEIYNKDFFPASVNGYTISNGVDYAFPDTVIQPGDYYVITIDPVFLMDNFGVVGQAWNPGGNLANGEDIIVLKDNLGAVVDSVAYTDTCPWPELADGMGHSMELCSAGQNNNIGGNWFGSVTDAGFMIGTEDIFASPGMPNSVCSSLASRLVITEIMYNPPETGTDFTEYIEIYNAGTESIDLDGLVVESGVTFTFPAEELDAGDYALIALDADAVRNLYNIPSSVFIWDWDAGTDLSNSSPQTITIFDAQGFKVDEVYYEQTLAYYNEKVDGNGWSLELCDADSDNLSPMNWKPSKQYSNLVVNNEEVFCTPGAQNSLDCSTADHTIMVTANGFEPADLTIFAGQTILWINNTPTEHNVDGSPTFLSGLPTCGPWTYCYTFESVGTYDYNSSTGDMGVINVDPPLVNEIVITEILYHQPGGGNSYDFIELYNRSQNVLNLEDYEIVNGTSFNLPNIAIDPGEYIVIANDAEAVATTFGIDAFEVIDGNLILSNTAQTITLTSNGNVIDEVSYTDTAPWPEIADGEGASMILCDINSENSDPLSWSFSTSEISVANPANPNLYLNATPGAPNDACPLLPSIFFGEDIPVSVTEGDTDTLTIQFRMANLNTTEEAFVDVIVESSSTATLDTDFYPLEYTIDFQPEEYGTTTIGRLKIVIVDDTEQEFTEKIVIRLANPVNATLSTTGVATIEIIDNDGFNPNLYPEAEIGEVTTVDSDGVGESNGTVAALTGIVYGFNIHPDGVEFTLIDKDNKEDGIRVFRNDNAPDYTVQEGDEVIVYGVITQFFGLTQIIPDNIILSSSGNVLFPADSISSGPIGEAEESKLIAIKGCVEWFDNLNVGSARQYSVRSLLTNEVYTMRVDDDVDVPETVDLPATFMLTGIGTQIDPGTAPFNTGYMIMPRYAADVSQQGCIVSTTYLEDLKVSVYPNPATDQLLINTDVALEKLIVYNMLGQTMLTKSVDQMRNTLDIQSLTPGCYLLTCIHQDKMRTVKFVKE